VILALLACLPKEAVGRQDDVEADRYRLEVSVATTTEGPVAIAPFTWRLEGELLSSWARSFRDGSLGRLVRLEGLKASVERDGKAVEVGTALDGAFLELRTFSSGEVLKVDPISPWAGDGAHLEVLDLIWPALSPNIPKLETGEPGAKITSWPTALAGLSPQRNRLEAAWTLDGRDGGEAAFSYRGTTSGGAQYTGTIEGNVTMDTRTPRLVSHALASTRTVKTQWPAGAVTQVQNLRIGLTFTGTAPAPHAVTPHREDDPSADAAPLQLSDGRTWPKAPADLSARLPYLLLPDDLGADAKAALHATLMDTGRLPAQETAP
jgi:hypothetical protein